MMKRKDIRLMSDKEKWGTYELIDGLFHMGIPVSIREHKSGFPAVTVDCGEVHILADILSLEEWWAHRKGKKENHKKGGQTVEAQ